jgi:hypothetical protein
MEVVKQPSCKVSNINNLTFFLEKYSGRVTVCAKWCCYLQEMSLVKAAYKNKLN